MERHAKMSRQDAMARFTAPSKAPAATAADDAPELEGLFVELIEE